MKLARIAADSQPRQGAGMPEDVASADAVFYYGWHSDAACLVDGLNFTESPGPADIKDSVNVCDMVIKNIRFQIGHG